MGKLFANILLSRFLSEVSGPRLLRNEQCGFKPIHSTVLHLARLIDRVSRNFGERRLTGFFAGHNIGRQSPLQTNSPYFPLILRKKSFFLPVWSGVCSNLPISHIHSSWHAVWRGSGWNNFSRALQSISATCLYHPTTLSGSLRARHVHHSHVPAASTARYLPGAISQRPRVVAERTEDHYQCLEEYCDAVC